MILFGEENYVPTSQWNLNMFLKKHMRYHGDVNLQNRNKIPVSGSHVRIFLAIKIAEKNAPNILNITCVNGLKLLRD